MRDRVLVHVITTAVLAGAVDAASSRPADLGALDIDS
jgi:hypothetical protein